MHDVVPCHVRGVHCDGCGTDMGGQYDHVVTTNVGNYYFCSTPCKHRIFTPYRTLLRNTIAVAFLVGILLLGLSNGATP